VLADLFPSTQSREARRVNCFDGNSEEKRLISFIQAAHIRGKVMIWPLRMNESNGSGSQNSGPAAIASSGEILVTSAAAMLNTASLPPVECVGGN
jgi:hypothetical protein